MTMQELTGTVRELRELRTMAEELAAEIAALEDTIKAEMKARGTDEFIAVRLRHLKISKNILEN